MAPQVLTSLLSELQEALRGKISKVLLVPITAAAAVLVFIHGSTHGWEWYTELWDDAGAVERALLIAATAFGFLFLALALDSLSPQLDRLFQSGVRATALRTKFYRQEWATRKQRKNDWEPVSRVVDGWRTESATDEDAEDEVSAPDSSWITGMVDLSIVVPAVRIPTNLEPGAVIDLYLPTNGVGALVPGGLLVKRVSDVSTFPDQRVSRAVMREITIAIPSEDITTVASAPVTRLLVSVRPTPTATPFWQPEDGWTRRWITRPEPHNPDFQEPQPGDLLKVSDNNGSPVTVTFCERVGDRWIVAFSGKDSTFGTVPPSFRLPVSRAKWCPASVPIPRATATISKWSEISDASIEVVDVKVFGGKVLVDNREVESGVVFTERSGLENRYTIEEIKAGSPFLLQSVNPEGDHQLGIRDWEPTWLIPEFPKEYRPNVEDLCHFRVSNGETTAVIFNSRMLKNLKIAIPAVIRTEHLQFLYANSKGVLPNAPSVQGEGVPYVCEVAMEISLPGPWPKAIPYGTPITIVQGESRKEPGRRESHATKLREVTPPTSSAISEQDSNAVIAAIATTPTDATAGKRQQRVLALSNFTPTHGIEWKFTDEFKCPADLIRKLIDATSEPEALDAARRLVVARASANAHLRLNAASEGAREFEEGEPEIRQAVRYWVDRCRQDWNLYFPANPNQVVGTRFGNIYQTIASYGHEVYGMHTPIVLTRIIKLVDPDKRGPYDAAKERIALLQWSFVSGLVIAIVGAWMLFRSGAAWWQPILLYVVAGLAVPNACLRGLASTGLLFAEEAKFLMDTQRGIVFDALGIKRPEGASATNLYKLERKAWMTTAQWLEYGTDDTDDYEIDNVVYKVPPDVSNKAEKEAAK